MSADVTALVPVKALERAKQRLAGELDAAARRHLVRWMAARVLAACSGARAVGRVVVVAGDAEAAALGQDHGVESVVVREPGLSRGLVAAERRCAAAHASLVVPADLPWATAAELDRLCAAVPAGRTGVALVAATDGGTGALLRRPGGVIVAAFGPGSAARHRDRARRAGVPLVTLELPGLQRDVDRPGDLAALPDTALPGSRPEWRE